MTTNTDWFRRAARTFLQLVAAGGLTALTEQVASDIPAAYAPYIMLVYTVLITAVQNYLEDEKGLPAVLKAPASSGENPVPEAK